MSSGAIVGRLLLRPGAAVPIECERPMVGAGLLARLTAGRRAALVPDLIAAVFTVGAQAQRFTSRRAVMAAMGLTESDDDAERENLIITLATVREGLQRLALDLPAAIQVPGVPPQVQWLRDSPLIALSLQAGGTPVAGLRDAYAALPAWIERRLLGMPAGEWLDDWRTAPAAWLDRWSAVRDHPAAHWLRGVQRQASGVALPLRALEPLDPRFAGIEQLADAVFGDATFAERPLWGGAPAETGPWTRAGRAEPVLTLWERLGARLADLAHLARGDTLACGALTVAAGQGVAWTEMSRGLLVHAVRLEPGSRDPATARVASYHVLAPTEWNFHPEGALGRALRSGDLSPAQARLAAATLDPCVEYAIEGEGSHA